MIRFDYLWDIDHQNGLSTSNKERPCAIVLYTKATNKTLVVPISHSYPEPGQEDYSLEIPPEICAEIGLYKDRNWVRVSEVNEFEWPSPEYAHVLKILHEWITEWYPRRFFSKSVNASPMR